MEIYDKHLCVDLFSLACEIISLKLTLTAGGLFHTKASTSIDSTESYCLVGLACVCSTGVPSVLFMSRITHTRTHIPYGDDVGRSDVWIMVVCVYGCRAPFNL